MYLYQRNKIIGKGNDYFEEECDNKKHVKILSNYNLVEGFINKYIPLTKK